jgi:hypothetical protein
MSCVSRRLENPGKDVARIFSIFGTLGPNLCKKVTSQKLFHQFINLETSNKVDAIGGKALRGCAKTLSFLLFKRLS